MIHKVFTYNIESIHFEKASLWCGVDKNFQTLECSAFNPLFQLLDKISADVSKFTSVVNKESTRSIYNFFLALTFISIDAGLICLGVLGVFEIYYGSIIMVNIDELLIKCLVLSLIAAVTWGGIIVVTFYKTSWINMVMFDYFIVGIVGIFLSTITLTHYFNAALKQNATELEMAVAKKTCSVSTRNLGRYKSSSVSYKNFDSEAACVPISRGSDDGETIRVSGYESSYSFNVVIDTQQQVELNSFEFPVGKRRFNKFKEGEKVKVILNNGALGFTWIDSSKIEPAFNVK